MDPAGKTFFRKKKQPVPVSLQSREWGKQVKAATEATYMFKPKGNSISIRFALSFHRLGRSIGLQYVTICVSSCLSSKASWRMTKATAQ